MHYRRSMQCANFCKRYSASSRRLYENNCAMYWQLRLQKLWPRALEGYANSGSFRGSGSNFRDFIIPFSGQLLSEHHDALLSAVMDNGRNWDAVETPQLPLSLLKNSAVATFPTHQARDRFFQSLRQHHRVDRYDDVLALLRDDDWVPPAAVQAVGERD